MKKYLLLAIVTLMYSSSFACTAIAAAGSAVVGGGTLLAKNRDALPFGFERVEVIKPKDAYAYVALVYGRNSKEFPYISSGINQFGLAITANDEASQRIKGQDDAQIETDLIKNILSHYQSVAQVKKDAKKLFSNNKLAIYTLSDSKQVASFQVGKKHNHAQKVTKNGVVWNTNYYNLPALNWQNKKIPATTSSRNDTMKLWLGNNKPPYKVGDFYQLLASYYHSQFDSINRDYTIARFIVVNKNNKSHVYINLNIPTQKYQAYRFVVTPDFFESQKPGLIDRKYSVFEQMRAKINKK